MVLLGVWRKKQIPRKPHILFSGMNGMAQSCRQLIKIVREITSCYLVLRGKPQYKTYMRTTTMLPCSPFTFIPPFLWKAVCQLSLILTWFLCEGLYVFLESSMMEFRTHYSKTWHQAFKKTAEAGKPLFSPPPHSSSLKQAIQYSLSFLQGTGITPEERNVLIHCWRLLCHIKLIINKCVCFSLVNLSFIICDSAMSLVTEEAKKTVVSYKWK